MDSNNKDEKFTFFFKTQSPFSQFHRASFVAKPMRFHPEDEDNNNEALQFLHCEQWMMYHKAKLFKDEDSAAKIMNAKNPPICKSLGRKVKNFDPDIWNEHNREIIYTGNKHKFMQNKGLLQAMLATKGTTLVEASPYDKIYGIGLVASDPRALDRKTWNGQNLLGEVLTELREELAKRNANATDPADANK